MASRNGSASDEMEEAKVRVSKMSELAKRDPGVAVEPDNARALALIQLRDPPLWVRTKADLKLAKVPMTDLTRAMKLAARPESKSSTTETVLVGQMLPTCPWPDLIVPSPYYLLEGATEKQEYSQNGDSRLVTVALAPVLVTGRVKDTEDGTEHLRLAWSRSGKWHELLAERGQVFSTRKLVELASAGFPVAEPTARDLVGYLAQFEAANLDRLPCTRVAGHLGWQGRNGADGFLWGAYLLHPDGRRIKGSDLDQGVAAECDIASVSFRGSTPGDDQLARGFHAEGSFEEWCRHVSVIADFPRILLPFYAAFVPPVLELLEAPNFVVDLANHTSTGKTTALRVVASVWGNPDEKLPNSVVGTWDSTKVYAERASATLSGLPVILDDTKRARRAEVVAEMIYSIASGRGRGRGSLKSLSLTRIWRTVMFSSGEAPATSFTQDGGSRMRCLEIRGAPFGARDAEAGLIATRLNQGILHEFGHAGPRFVEWMMARRDRWSQDRLVYQHETARFAGMVQDPAAGRLAQYAAAIDVTARLVHDALDLPWKYAETVEQLWPELVAEASDAAGEERALQDVVSMAISKEESFYGRAPQAGLECRIPSGGWLGRWDKEDWPYLAILPHVIEQWLRLLKFEPEAILHAWQERGWLDTDPDRRVKQVRAGHQRTRMICIRRAAIEGLDRGQWGQVGDTSGDNQEEAI